MRKVPDDRVGRRQLLQQTIGERSRRGRGGGVGSDWAERALRREQAEAPPRRGHRVLLSALLGLILVCAAAGAGGSLIVWNGQKDGTLLSLQEARSVLADPDADPNLRRTAASVLYVFAKDAIEGLVERTADEEPSLTEARDVWLRKLQRRLSRD